MQLDDVAPNGLAVGRVDLTGAVRACNLSFDDNTRIKAELLPDAQPVPIQFARDVDFHSTDKNTFYTQLEPTDPPGFTRAWLGNAEARIENYPFTNGEAPTKNPTVAKNYVYARYGIPAVTFEAGDETDRDAVRDAAVVFAEELMRLMLSQDY